MRRHDLTKIPTYLPIIPTFITIRLPTYLYGQLALLGIWLSHWAARANVGMMRGREAGNIFSIVVHLIEVDF